MNNLCYDCGPVSANRGFSELFTPIDSKFDPLKKTDQEAVMPDKMRHPNYDEWLSCWEDLRIAIKGTKAVREAAVERGWIEPPENIEFMLAFGKPAQKQQAARQLVYYVNRAEYPEIVRFARDITVGRILRQDTSFEGFFEDEDKTAGVDDYEVEVLDRGEEKGRNFKDFSKMLLKEKFTTGWTATYVYPVVDPDRSVNARWKTYIAENIWNYKQIDGRLVYVVFRELVPDPKAGRFSHKKIYQFRELSLDDISETNRGKLVERIWRIPADGRKQKYEVFDEKPIMIRERTLSEIPVVFDGGQEPENPPYQALARKAIEAVQISAQLKHRLYRIHGSWLNVNYQTSTGKICRPGEDRTGQGNLNRAMKKPEGKKQPIVPGLGILETQEAETKWLIDEGAGVDKLQAERTEIKLDMASLGARFGINYGASNVSTDTERMQQGGETAFIIGHVEGTSVALTHIARWKATIEGRTEKTVNGLKITLNTELTDEGLPYTLENVVLMVEKDIIDPETALSLVKRLVPQIPDDLEWDEVAKRIRDQSINEFFPDGDDEDDDTDEEGDDTEDSEGDGE